MRGPIAGLALTLFAAVSAPAFAETVTVAAPEATRFPGYEGAPVLQVTSRKDESFFYPCQQCHEAMEPDPTIRSLEDAVHEVTLDHGDQRFWCTSCHNLPDRDYLVTLLGEPVDYDQSHLVCGGCHGARHRDWYFGAHGKRVNSWQGERTVLGCPECHDPHAPAIQQRAPQPPPPMRAGLAPHAPDTGAGDDHATGDHGHE